MDFFRLKTIIPIFTINHEIFLCKSLDFQGGQFFPGIHFSMVSIAVEESIESQSISLDGSFMGKGVRIGPYNEKERLARLERDSRRYGNTITQSQRQIAKSTDQLNRLLQSFPQMKRMKFLPNFRIHSVCFKPFLRRVYVGTKWVYAVETPYDIYLRTSFLFFMSDLVLFLKLTKITK